MDSADPSPADPSPEPEDRPPRYRDTFCIHPWHHFRVQAGGEAIVCCAFEGGHVADNGAPMSLDRHSLAEIWNSPAMREVRGEMVAGRRVAGCRQCYADEARGGLSQRLTHNAAWEAGWLNPEGDTIAGIAARAEADRFAAPALPALIEIETGSLCNLKCRMCNGRTSSLIAKDPVHRAWSDAGIGFDAASGCRLRRPASIARLGAELAADGDGRVKRLYFIGGEPMLVREVRGLLERLIAGGRAGEIELSMVSNGTVMPRWLSLAAAFRRFDLAVSIDGHGKHYEYIRYPARWDGLTRRLRQYREIPNLNLSVTATIQVNNALNITRLFRHLDSAGIGFGAYLLHWPHHLAATALPAPLRRLAAARLRDYGDGDCRPQHRALVASLAAQFEAGDDTADPALLREFMLFTNDLDAARGQSIHRSDPELVAVLAEAGFPWIAERRHAARSA